MGVPMYHKLLLVWYTHNSREGVLFQPKSTDIFLIEENMLWVLIGSASLRHFHWDSHNIMFLWKNKKTIYLDNLLSRALEKLEKYLYLLSIAAFCVLKIPRIVSWILYFLNQSRVGFNLNQLRCHPHFQWFIYNFTPMRPRTRLGYIKWVLLENHCVHYRIFHYNFVSPGTHWDLKCEFQSKNVSTGLGMRR